MAAFLGGGGAQEQAGEELDRLGLLHAGEASKPRTVEPELVFQNNPPSIERRGGAGRESVNDRKAPYRDKDRNGRI